MVGKIVALGAAFAWISLLVVWFASGEDPPGALWLIAAFFTLGNLAVDVVEGRRGRS